MKGLADTHGSFIRLIIPPQATNAGGHRIIQIEGLYQKITDALAEGDVRVPAGYKFSIEQIQKWIDEAKSLV